MTAGFLSPRVLNQSIIDIKSTLNPLTLQDSKLNIYSCTDDKASEGYKSHHHVRE